MKKYERSKLEIAFPFIVVVLVIGGALLLGILSNTSGGGSSDGPTVQLDNSQAYFFGAEDAKVVLTEFSDFQCPACRSLSPVLKNLVDSYSKEVKLYYRHFPIPGHTEAQKAAEAAEAAGEQGKFWEMHDKIFENQASLGVDNYKKWASDLGLDSEKFNDCLDSGKFADEISKDTADGAAAGVSGTPGFIINGKLVSGAQPFAVFKSAIEAELK